MVAVVSGSGIGLFNSSLSVLGGNGASGSAPNGRSSDRVYVNSATGNLVIQSQDETLAALGLDLGLLRTYNAQGKLDDDNADNWKIGLYRRVYALTGTVNTAGSTVTKVFGDGAEVVYTYDTVSGKYVGADGNGAHDTLSWSTSASQWTWTDGSTRVAETYDSAGTLRNAKDIDGNTLTYNYTGALLTSVVDASGQTTYLDYTGNLLQKIRVVSSGVTQTLTLYTYDASNRLSTVTVDLSPTDNVVSDNNKWVTTYTYDGTSARVASITQRYGTSANAMSSASFVYQLLNGAYRVTSFTDGEGKTTNIAYSGATVSGGQTLYLTTDVTDPLGLVTTYTKDTQGRLTSVLSPTVSGVRLEKRYAYDANGNVTSVTEDPTGLNRVTTFQYDGAGNLLLTRDNAGNTITRTYSATNQVLTETNYLTPDPDGAGAGTASNPFTTRYAYDAEQHLRFIISSDGRVTEYRYNGAGQRLAMLKYIGTPYSVGGLSPTTTLSESQMATWASTQTQTNLERADYAYDFRGNLSTTSAYLTTDTAGVGAVATASVTRYVYDQRGNLLQRIDPRGELTTTDTSDFVTNFTYDGAGRLLATSQWISSTVNGGTTTVIRLKELMSYDDVNNKVVMTYGVTETTINNGAPVADAGLRVATAAYNHNGALQTLTNGTAASTTAYGTTTYLYDADNRLRVTTDPTGISQYVIYDEASRVVGTIDGDGTLIESVYNKANQVVKTVRYADRVPTATIATLVSGGVPANVTLATIKAAIPGTVGRASDQFVRTIYDAAGRSAYRLTQAQDQGGATSYSVTQYLYDGASRVTDVIQYKNVATVLATVGEVTGFTAPTADTTNDRRTRNFFDNDGHLTGTLDALGYLTEYVYDSVGHLSQKIAYATATSSSLWATGTLATLKSGLAVDYANASTALTEEGATTYYYYDFQGRQLGELDGEGILNETVYNVAGLVDSVVRYNHAGLTYDPVFGNLKAQVAANTQFSMINGYDGAGRLVSATDHKWATTGFADILTTYTYDALGNLISSTRAAGTSEARQLQKTYDGMGRILQELTAEGYAITHTYDAAGRRIRTTGINDSQASGEPAPYTPPYTLYFYDADNRLQYTVNSKGEIAENRYNALGQLTTSVVYSKRLSATATANLTGGTATSTLTSAMTSETIANAANDRVTSYVYTLAGLLQSTTTAEGAVVSDTYDVFRESSLHTTLQSTGVSTPFARTYNRLGEVTDTQDDQGGINATLHFDYDAFGRVTRVTDQYGNASRTEYDRLGRTINTYSALSIPSRHTYSYDAFSRTLKVTNYAGGTPNDTNYQYVDNLASPSMTVTTPEGVAVTTTFNRFGQQLSVTVNGNTTNYSYDANGNLKTITDSLGTLESRSYDRAGRLASTTDAKGVVTTLLYDAAARVLTRTVDVGTGKLNLSTSYTYDGQGRVSTVTEPNGRVTTTSYDRDGRVTLIAVSNGAKTEKTQYSYDKAGHVIQVDEENAAGTALRTTQYTFDHLGRRTDEYVLNADVGGTPTTLHTVYKYDQNGNLVRKIDPKGKSTWFVYDADNRQTYVIDALGGVTGTSYDSENRVVATRRFAAATAIPTVDRVTGFTPPNPQAGVDRVEQTVYDTDGRAVYQIRELFISGVNSAIVTRMDYDGAGNVVRRTAYFNAIAPGNFIKVSDIAVTGNAADRVARTLYDARNRVFASVDAVGAVTRYAYNGIGNVTSKTEFRALYTNAAATDAQLRSDVTALTVGTTDRVTNYWYDSKNRVVDILDAEGYLTKSSYNDATRTQTTTIYAAKPTVVGNASTPPTAIVTAGADQTTTTTFDTMGRVVSVKDALNVSESYSYDEVGNRVGFTNKKGQTWQYAYDANHRLTMETAPPVVVYNMTDGATLASATFSTIGLQTVYQYDALGNVTARIEGSNAPAGQSRTTRYGYDALGRQVTTTYPAIAVYNPTADNVTNAGTAVTGSNNAPATLVSTVAYDTLGNAWKSIDVAGNLSYKIYDKLGRLTQEIDALGYVTTHAYSVFGNEMTLTRYATAYTGAAPISGKTAIATSGIANATLDRTLSKTYDKRNELLTVAQSNVSNYDTLAGSTSGGGVPYQAASVTQYDYDAFGNVVRARTAVAYGATADTYSYYDRRNHKVAEISPLGYFTSYQYNDATGDLTQQNEYATPVSTLPTTITATAPQAPAGASNDRTTVYVYDLLDRLSQRQQVNIEASSFSGSTLSTNSSTTDTTIYVYDAVGNQTSITVNGVTSYSYFDALGRILAIAEPLRDRGDTTTITPLTEYRRDAYGNIVEQVQYGNGATTPTSGIGNTPNANSPDRITRNVYNLFGKPIHTQDPAGAQRFASYTAKGELAKEWLPTTGTDPSGNSVTETVVTYYGYDSLGHVTAMIQPQTVGGASPAIVNAVTQYNAFGEVTAKGYGVTFTSNLVSDQLKPLTTNVTEKFEYDLAGRVWRSNQTDGIGKVYLYNVAGQATAVIKADPSKVSPTNLMTAVSYADVASGLSGISNLVRTETVYDLQGRAIQQRDVTFTSGSGLDPISGTFAAGKPSGGNLLLYWTTIPPAYVIRAFYYAAPGTPLNGTGWTSLPVTTINIAGTQYNAVVISGLSGAVDIKVTYTRAGVATPYAIHTGGMTITSGSTSYTIAVTPRAAIVASATVTTVNYSSAIIQWSKASAAVSATAEMYVNNAWQGVSVGTSGNFWQASGVYTNIGPTPFRITEFDSTGQIVARTAGSLLNNGSSYSVVGGSTPSNITGFTNAGGGILGWTTASSAGATVNFRYRVNSASPWLTAPATVWGTGFSVDLRAVNGTFQYEVDYTASGATSPYAIGQGSTTITTSTSAAIASSPTDSTSLYLVATYTPLFIQDVDRWGQVRNYYDVYNNRTQYRYNERGQVVDITQPTTTIVSTSNGTVTASTAAPLSHNYYDVNGLLIATVDADGNRNRINYNAAGQATSEVTADSTTIAGTSSGTKSYVYDAFGDQVQITDALGYRTRQGFDGDGRVTRIAYEMAKPVPVTLPNGSFGFADPYQSTFATITGTAAAGVISQLYIYDQAGRRRSETTGEIIDGSSNDETIKYWYDLMGHVIRRRDPAPTLTPQPGSTPVVHDTLYTYDPYGLGKKYQETDSLVDHNTQLWQYDVYGKLIAHTDLSGTTYTYNHDSITQLLTSRTISVVGGGGETATYTYDAEGRVTRIAETSSAHSANTVASTNTATDVALTAITRQTDYSYDLAGRVIRETVTEDQGLATQAVQQDTSITYDELGRMAQINDPRYTLTYSYDAMGNRTHIVGSYLYQTPSTDLWYTYDGANRVLVSQGVLTGSSVDTATFGKGTKLTYNARGDRASATQMYGGPFTVFVRDNSTGTYWTTNASDDVETYAYDAVGRLTNIAQQTYQSPTSGGTRTVLGWQNIDTRTYDRASRQLTQQTVTLEWGFGGYTWFTRATTTGYDDDGRLKTQTETKNGVKEYTQLYGNGDADYPGGTGSYTYNGITYTWPIAAGYGIGYDSTGNLRGYTLQVFDSGGSVAYTSTCTIKYRAADGYQEISNAVSSSPGTSAAPAAGSTTRGYNVNNELVQFDDAQAPLKSRYFANNASGQAIIVVQGHYDGTSGRLTAAQALATVGAAQRQLIVQGQVVGTTNLSSAQFDVNYTPISNQYPGPTAPSVIVQSDDTLRIIAARIWGDGDLWYLIAQENGLTDPDAALTAGSELKLPNSVTTLKNNATTFRPYDASKVIGNTTPTQPAPPIPKADEGCGVFGEILMIIVAIVVTIYIDHSGKLGAELASWGVPQAAVPAAQAAIAAAAGSAASQVVGLATGNISEFSWKQVAAAAITAGVLKGTPLGHIAGADSNTGMNALQYAVNNAVAQGVNIVIGLQDSFDWKSLAASAVAAPIAGKLSGWVGKAVGDKLGAEAGEFAGQLAAGLTSAAVRTAFIGGKVDFAQIAADAFANVLGNSLADKVSAPKTPGEGSGGLTDQERADFRAKAQQESADELAAANAQMEADLRDSLTNNPIDITLPDMPPINFGPNTYTVKSGDTLERIARANGKGPEAAAAIADASGINLGDVIRPGQELVIPDSYDAVAEKNKYGKYVAGVNAAKAEVATAATQLDPNSFSGTLALSRQTGLSMDQIMALRSAPAASGGGGTATNYGSNFVDNYRVTEGTLGHQLTQNLSQALDQASQPNQGYFERLATSEILNSAMQARGAYDMLLDAANTPYRLDRAGQLLSYADHDARTSTDSTFARLDAFQNLLGGFETGLGLATGLQGGMGALRGLRAASSEAYAFDALNPGPLPDKIAGTFAGGRYSEGITTVDQRLFKAGNSADPGGSFFNFEPSEGVLQARIDNALKPQWIDQSTGVLTAESPVDSVISASFPSGTKFYYGPVSSQGGAFVGGLDKIQIYVPNARNIGTFTIVGPLE